MLKGLMLFSLIGLVVAGFVFARKRPSAAVLEDPMFAAPHEDAEGIVHVGAIRLWKDYDANAVAADNRYKDRTLRVTGRVLAIERPMGDLVMLDLAGGNPIFRTIAHLDSTETQKVATLTKGTVVTVECIGAGAMMRMPQLEDCVFLGTAGDPSP